MEDTLREKACLKAAKAACLNPCFNGRYSQSETVVNNGSREYVLILVLMEDTLREQRLVFLCLSLFDVCLPL